MNRPPELSKEELTNLVVEIKADIKKLKTTKRILKENLLALPPSQKEMVTATKLLLTSTEKLLQASETSLKMIRTRINIL